MDRKISIAIDGYSSCGKSTMAKSLAKRLSYIYIDTGAMYRAVTLYALREGLLHDGQLDEEALKARLDEIDICFCCNSQGQSEVCLGGENVEGQIRGMAVSNGVSIVAQVPAVREKMVLLQRQIAARKGTVMDGRDIGTVVLPDAELKIFVTAQARVRAQRRYDELKAKGQEASFDEIVKNIEMRDQMDLTRPVSPLRQAPDALVLDNSFMTLEEQDAWLNEKVGEVLHGRS
ncbi:MAG: (d)CMP kinase [Bacteroidales bacterium]|nr:(d)CMP kinase [Bacteroidales bacterium]